MASSPARRAAWESRKLSVPRRPWSIPQSSQSSPAQGDATPMARHCSGGRRPEQAADLHPLQILSNSTPNGGIGQAQADKQRRLAQAQKHAKKFSRKGDGRSKAGTSDSAPRACARRGAMQAWRRCLAKHGSAQIASAEVPTSAPSANGWKKLATRGIMISEETRQRLPPPSREFPPADTATTTAEATLQVPSPRPTISVTIRPSLGALCANRPKSCDCGLSCF